MQLDDAFRGGGNPDGKRWRTSEDKTPLPLVIQVLLKLSLMGPAAGARSRGGPGTTRRRARW